MTEVPEPDAKAAAEVLEGRERLAGAVSEALAAAGLTVHRGEFADAGVLVWVDPRADDYGGVYARWAVGRALQDELLAALREQDLAAPVVRRRGEAVAAMNEAVRRVLVAFGMRAESFRDDFVSPCVRVREVA
ncbi:hypothetical protein RM844_24755 [Streptomyces sp. DSM 44915]|uniref:Uncharacterized protein n=1 Tax=Streptomyces chisholmiae TaxID=3075540 RepID=A0ABU2JXL9_9ACTN|nr:hypothetical protein [Streptomyces sp. DSM 44915]MDT0269496.1 hypothetical protein [Streptomyces sp. DSM 44915]